MGIYSPPDPLVAGKFYVEVRADMYNTGQRNEDGEELIGESFAVYVSSPKGRRWVHGTTFSTRIAYSEEEGFPYLVGYEEADRKANALGKMIAEALRKGQKLNLECWTEVDPVYGSEAYESQGIEAQRAAEDRLAA